MFTRYIVRNFMSILSADINIQDNIVNFVGYNDSGKSALGMGLDVLFYDATPKKQSRYITRGEDSFHLELWDDNGYIVVKEKYRSGQSIWYFYHNNQLLYSNKQGTEVYSIDGVPEIVKKFLGVIIDPTTREKLNVRKKHDKLYIVNTTGGENYKSLNECLKAEILANASKYLNTDRNALQSELSRLSTLSDSLTQRVDAVKTVDETDLLALEKDAQTLNKNAQRLSAIGSVDVELKKVQEFHIWDELPSVNLERLLELASILELKQASSVRIHPECILVDIERLVACFNMNYWLKESTVKIGDAVQPIATGMLSDIVSAVREHNDIVKLNKELNDIATGYERCKLRVAKIVKENNLRVCKNCGALVD